MFPTSSRSKLNSKLGPMPSPLIRRGRRLSRPAWHQAKENGCITCSQAEPLTNKHSDPSQGYRSEDQEKLTDSVNEFMSMNSDTGAPKPASHPRKTLAFHSLLCSAGSTASSETAVIERWNERCSIDLLLSAGD